MYKDGRWSKNHKNQCICCKTVIGPLSVRCKSCNERYAHLGKKNTTWKPIGSSFVNTNGYRIIKIAENYWKSEHTFKVEEFIKRKLTKNEIVHHIDNNRSNNKLSNLYIFHQKWLHRMFTVLINYNVISFHVLTSNLRDVKKGKI